MSGYTVWQYTDTDLTALANQAKEQIISALANENLLKGDPEEIASQYVIVLYKRGFFGSLWDKFRGTDKDGTFFAVLKTVQHGISRDGGEEESEEEPKPTHLKAVSKSVPHGSE